MIISALAQEGAEGRAVGDVAGVGVKSITECTTEVCELVGVARNPDHGVA
jgi:hypothetical protein